LPWGPTALASRRLKKPVPQPISATAWPSRSFIAAITSSGFSDSSRPSRSSHCACSAPNTGAGWRGV